MRWHSLPRPEDPEGRRLLCLLHGNLPGSPRAAPRRMPHIPARRGARRSHVWPRAGTERARASAPGRRDAAPVAVQRCVAEDKPGLLERADQTAFNAVWKDPRGNTAWERTQAGKHVQGGPRPKRPAVCRRRCHMQRRPERDSLARSSSGIHFPSRPSSE